MKNTIHFDSLRGYWRAGRALVTLVVLSGAGLMSATPAAAYPEYVYKATAAGYPNITMNLVITDVNGTYDATGGIYLGTDSFDLTGTFAGTLLNAGATINATGPVFGTPVPVNGILTGALGTGSIKVYTGYLAFNANTNLALEFELQPVAPPTSTSSPAPSAGNPAPVLPKTVHMSGGAGGNYTTVTLTLDLTSCTVPARLPACPASAYRVSGTIAADELIVCASLTCTTHHVYATMDISAVLTPGVTGTINILNPPAGNTPRYQGTIGPTATTFTSELTNVPAVGIYALYIDAQQ